MNSKTGIAAFGTGWLVLLLFSVLVSCKKDGKNEDMPDDSVYEFSVLFDAGTIPFGLVDSGFVVFRRTGTQTDYLLRFDKYDSRLTVSTDGFRAGEWVAHMYVYGRMANSVYKREYTDTLVFNISTQREAIRVKGPDNTFTGAWEPYLLLTRDPELVVSVPLDNTNPYFEIRTADASKWKEFYMSRSALYRASAVSGNELKAEASFDCLSGCFTHGSSIIDKTTFLPFSELVKTKTWNNGEIDVIITDKQGQTTEFYVPYNI